MAPELNEGQRRAVEHLAGRLLITAGAGSGKTRTLAERFAYAVGTAEEKGITDEVDRILTITYTEKAAGELAERVRVALRARNLGVQARAVDGAWISTIHTFCTRILRREALAAGIDPGFRIADEVQASSISVAAFETVARRRLESGCTSTRRLFDSYGYAETRTAVVQIARTLHARGIAVGSVELEESDSVDAIVREGRESFSSAAECFAAHIGKAKSPAAHRDACGEMCERLGQIGDAESSGDGEIPAAERTWRALISYGATRHSTKDTKETVASLMLTRDELAERCVRILVRPFGTTLLSMVDEYLTAYGEAKRVRGLFDFDDLIVATRDLFDGDSEVLERYRKRFKLVMVDEFQDTDAMQLAFIKAVGEPDLATVGDVRQSIYSFRGADIEVYRGHREEMAEAGAVHAELAENFRSHADIIGFVNTTFGSEELFGTEDTGLVARRNREEPRIAPDDPRIEFTLVDTSDGTRAAESLVVEAEVVAERFARLRECGFEASDMAVLVRAYADAPAFATALDRAGFSTTVVGGDRFLQLHEVAALRALCRVLANPHDDEAMVRLLVSDLVDIDDDSLARVAADESGTRRRGSLWGSLRDPARWKESPNPFANVIASVENARARVGATSLTAVVRAAVEELGFVDTLTSRGVEGRLALANVVQFYRKIAAFERGGGAGPAELVASLDAEEASGLRQSAATSVGEGGAVTIMSIHSAKGLEFPVVAVPTLGKAVKRSESGFHALLTDEGRAILALKLPRSFAPDNKKGLPSATRGFEAAQQRRLEAECTEAKRLLYVACTRAEDVLILVGSGKADKALETKDETPLAWLLRAHGAKLLAPLPEGGPAAQTVRIGESPVRVERRRPAEPGDGGQTEERADEPATAPARHVPRIQREQPRPVSSDRISYSDIQLYRKCSLRYWAERVVRMERLDGRAGESASAFGSALHAVLQLAGDTRRLPGADRIAAIGRGLGLSETQRCRLGEVAANYLGSDRARNMLSDWETLTAEEPFAVRLGGEDGPLLVGTIDTYASKGSRVLVLDYKSGPGRFYDDAAGSGADGNYRLQAECYALAALRDGAERVDVRFVFPEATDDTGEPRELAFAFGRNDREPIESALIETWERMGREPYRDCGVWRVDSCGGCPASGTVCRLTPPRRGAA